MKNKFFPKPFIIYLIVILSIMILFANWRNLNVSFNGIRNRSLASNTLPLQLIWSYHSEKPFRSEPMGNATVTIIREDNSLLKAFENETGELIWEYNAPNSISSGSNMMVNEEMLVGASGSGNQSYLFMLDASTGEEAWKTLLSAHPTRTPDVVIINNMVITAKRSKGGFFIAGYDLRDGTQQWDGSSMLPPTGYSGMVECSSEYFDLNTSPDAILCVIYDNHIYIVEPDSGTLLEHLVAPFSLHNDPVFSDGMFFASTNDAKSVVQVFDLKQTMLYSLPATCSEEKFASSVAISNQKVLVVNGCDEVYFVSATELRDPPDWIYSSPISISSQFVSLDGSVGYILDDSVRIVGIDLVTGEIIGSITTEPDAEMEDEKQVNGLYLNPPYMYAVMDEGNLMIFKMVSNP